jgi:hypothetical protein
MLVNREMGGRYLALEPDGTARVSKAEGGSYKYVDFPELGLAHSR